MAKEKGEVVRTWQPAHEESLARIETTIDSWDRAHGHGEHAAATPPSRDYAAIEAAVDRITKRVKTRKVVVKKTVTEYVEVPVEDEAPAAPHATTRAAPVAQVQDLAAVAKPAGSPEAKPAKLGFFARRKAAKEAKATASTVTIPAHVPAAKPRTVTVDDDGDAWDPGTAQAVSAPKPLQSKAAKRTAKSSTKGGSKKR